ncbi:hypothetical protein D3C74_99700 [compost metagenome]
MQTLTQWKPPRFGISANRAQNYHADSEGVELNFRVMSEAVATLRECSAMPESRSRGRRGIKNIKCSRLAFTNYDKVRYSELQFMTIVITANAKRTLHITPKRGGFNAKVNYNSQYEFMNEEAGAKIVKEFFEGLFKKHGVKP